MEKIGYKLKLIRSKRRENKMKYVVYKLLNALVILIICYYLLKALYALGSKYLIDIHLFNPYS